MKKNPDKILKRIAIKIGTYVPDMASKWIKNPVFVIGCGRSGTTLLTTILAKHKDIANYSEANDIWDPNGYPWRFSNLTRPPVWKDPNTFNRMWWEDVSKTGYARKIKGIFGAYQFISRKKIFLNKTPMNTFKIPYILEIFPGARFIHIYRDGRAVSYSYQKKEYKKMIENPEPYKKTGHFYTGKILLEMMAKSWIDHIKEVENQKQKLKQKFIFFELSYEEFCESPREMMNEIYDFLKIDKKRTGIQKFPPIKNMNFKYKKDLDEGMIQMLNRVMKSGLIQKGYKKK
jgi:hypothetical protein